MGTDPAAYPENTTKNEVNKMAIVATYTSKNCPGMPEGCVVHVDDSALEKDQKAAWDRAYAVAFKIHEQQQKRKAKGE